MRRTAAIYIILFALLLILLLALITVDNAMAVQPSCVEYDRLEEQSEIDPSVTITIAEDIELCQVHVKAARDFFYFTEDGCQNGYCVTGFGTNEIVVERTCDESPECHEISHIALYKVDRPTSVEWPSPFPWPWEFPWLSYKVYLPAIGEK